MPLLGEETTLHPEDLLEEMVPEPSDSQWSSDGQWPPDREGSLERQWMVLYTKARQEKSLSRELLAYQIPFYLPLIPKTSVARGRNVTSYIPLFASYVFLYGSEEERIRSLTTNRISRILPIDDPERLVHDLRQLSRLISADAPLTMESRLAPGNRVRVQNGPFAGLEGTVLNRRGATRLLVSINFLQQGASVEIEDFLLEPLD